MSDTYTQIHIHAVFAVKNRKSLIAPDWRDRLYQYIISIIEQHGHKVLSIGGTADHVHILFGLRPTQSLSALMHEVKRGSSFWINQNNLVNGEFKWQGGYGAFSYSKSHISNVARYIEKQEEHHKKQSLRDEYIAMLKKFQIEYDERNVFRNVDV